MPILLFIVLDVGAIVLSLANAFVLESLVKQY